MASTTKGPGWTGWVSRGSESSKMTRHVAPPSGLVAVDSPVRKPGGMFTFRAARVGPVHNTCIRSGAIHVWIHGVLGKVWMALPRTCPTSTGVPPDVADLSRTG